MPRECMALSFMDSTLALSTIRCALERISEDHFMATWCSGVEYSVWTWMQQNGDRPIPEYEKAFLRQLADRAGGWVCWDHESDRVQFVPLKEWRTRYASWAVANDVRPSGEPERTLLPQNEVLPITLNQATAHINELIPKLMDSLLLWYFQAADAGSLDAAQILKNMTTAISVGYSHALHGKPNL